MSIPATARPAVPPAVPPARTPAVKVCGLTRAGDVAVAVQAGARFLGGIRAGGPRLLAPEAWRALLPPRTDGVQRVAVLGAAPAAALIGEIDRLGCDIAQLHGDPTPEDVTVIREATGVTVWPVLRLRDATWPPLASSLTDAAGWLVLDAQVPGQLGGTGVALPWERLASHVARWRAAHPRARLILAGGLRPDNVAHAVAVLRPDVVDVSSGVERAPGLKDPARVHAFVHAVSGAS